MKQLIIMGLICLYAGASPIVAEASATVSLTSDISTVGVGGSINFTVTVTPGDHVTRVILGYEGEPGQDEDTSYPWSFSHEFNTPMDNLTVTATVEYNNSDPDGYATLDVNVVGLTITGSASPLRGQNAGYIAESSPAGKAIDQFDWTYQWSGDSNNYQDNDIDGNDKSAWAGKMVTKGTLTCSATISGVAVQKSLSIDVRARSWAVPITCVRDNEVDWGEEPEIGEALGLNRDRDSNIISYFFVPQASGTDFSAARTLSQVTSGPCSGLWYVYTSTLKCQRETAINKYIKSGGPLPVGASTNFYDINETACFAPWSHSAASFVLAVHNHDYRGTPDTFKSPEGHQGLIEIAIIDEYHDAKAAIESQVNRNAEDLACDIDDIIGYHQCEVESRCDDQYPDLYGPNWGSGDGALGSGGHSRWDPATSSWTICDNGPLEF